MADTVIESLITKLSFDFDEDTLERFDSAIEDAAKGLVAIVAGATAAATAIFAFTKSIAESNDELGKFAQRIGIDAQTLQELGLVAEFNGGSIDSMNSSLANLSRISSEAARGIGAGVETFGLLGISVTDAKGQLKGADDLLFDISDAIARLGSQAERLEFTQKLGIGEDLLLAVQQGSDAIRKQRQEAQELGFVIDQDATDAAANFNDEMLRATRIVSGMASAIGTRLMKQIQPMLESFVEWFKVNKDIIKQNLNMFLDKMITSIRGVFNVGLRVVGIINSLVSAMGGWKNTIVAVSGLLLAMNASALLMPILAVASGAAILLILEDMVKFAEGGDSAIGQLAKKWEGLDIILRGFLKLLGMIKDGWVLIFTEGDDAFEGMMMMVRDAGKAIDEFITDKINAAIELINKIPGITVKGIEFIGDIDEKIPEATAGFFDKMKSFAKASAQAFSDIQRPEQVQIQRIQGLLPQPAGQITNKTTSANTITVNINGGDPDRVRKIVTDVLSEQYSGAQTNLASQVEQ